MRELTIIPDAALLVRDGLIAWVGPAKDAPRAEQTRDLGGVAVTPALTDPHTHAVWAGDRLGDFEARVEGVPYETILARGGGIRSTMRATRQASLDELVALALPRLQALSASGAATIEIKSGYGLDFETELRMLEAVGCCNCKRLPTCAHPAPPRSARRGPRRVCPGGLPQPDSPRGRGEVGGGGGRVLRDGSLQRSRNPRHP